MRKCKNREGSRCFGIESLLECAHPSLASLHIKNPVPVPAPLGFLRRVKKFLFR